MFWIRPTDYGETHLVANIYATANQQLRDEGGKDTWGADYNVLVRVHSRFRKQLLSLAYTRELPEGVHVGIARQTRATYVPYEDGTMPTIRDLRSPDGRATSPSSYWK